MWWERYYFQLDFEFEGNRSIELYWKIIIATWWWYLLPVPFPILHPLLLHSALVTNNTASIAEKPLHFIKLSLSRWPRLGMNMVTVFMHIHIFKWIQRVPQREDDLALLTYICTVQYYHHICVSYFLILLSLSLMGNNKMIRRFDLYNLTLD